MKIALLTPTFCEFSGIDRVVEMQAQDLLRNGHHVTIIALDATISAGKSEILVMGMPKTLFWQRIYRLFFFFDVVKIIRFVRTLRNFDVIYSHFYPMNILALCAKIFYTRKYVYYNHGVSPSTTFQKLHEKLYITVFRFLNNITARHADHVISISQYLAGVFQNETGKDSEVKHNKINNKRFYEGIDGSLVRKKYHLGKDPLILYVGRISPHKGVDLLIKSFHVVLKNMPDAKLLIVGKPTFEAYSKTLKDIAGPSVIFTGFVSDNELPKYFGACDVYATASLWEGFDMPLVEAQACDKPVVAFNIGPHQELINTKGILVPEKDTQAFAGALILVSEKNQMDAL